MTDLLSVSASISGLLTLADIVFRRTYKYVKAVKKGPKEISALSTEIGALYGVLSNLDLVSRQLEHEQAESTTRIHHIHSCYQTLEHVKSILDKDDSSSLRDERLETLKRKLRWPFTSSEVKELIAEIERHKTTLGLALNVDCMSGLLQALSKHDEIRDTIEGIRVELKERHEAETRIAINKETQEILQSLAKVDSRSNFEMSRKLRSPGTGLWFTEGQDFRQWLETQNARLWLYGIPGAGKTVLASSIIEEALRTTSSSTAIAFFYCDYKNAATQDLSNILGSLAQQFAKQDEASFAKVRHFYKSHNPEHRPDFKYDSEALLDLVRAVTSDFNNAMIIIDGLDECGTNTPQVVDAITTLDDGGDTVKTLFLSRDEIEIRERLENYSKVSIAASSSDLRLYVGAEIGLRTRQKRLRIKDQSLKETIFERLVEGAEGMFRWVACQMDYMCELPNDDARRKALDSLPPDLISTYERILTRVNQSNPETQKLVRRALRWITHGSREVPLTTEALCEAVSIDFGDTKRNLQAIPDEFEILHWCSSLVRKSSDGEWLELAHFTVQEFLEQIDPSRDVSIGAYRIDPIADEIVLAKVKLTYLNFEDFDQSESFDQQVIERRLQEYPFRRYAVKEWLNVPNRSSKDNELVSLLQKLLSPSKPNTLISWMHDMIYHNLYVLGLHDKRKINMIDVGVAEMTALHWAAMLGSKKMCSWLIGSGCDVNRNTEFGTPLHCALLRRGAIETRFWAGDSSRWREIVNDDVVDLLLEAGADPNFYYGSGTRKCSALFIALSSDSADLVVRMLEKGGVLDKLCLDKLESHLESKNIYETSDRLLDFEDVSKIIERLNSHNVQPDHHGRFLQLALKAKASNATRLMQEDANLFLRDTHCEQALRNAAKVGQVEVVTRLLEGGRLDVDAADEDTGLTALHQATRTDQPLVAQTLIDYGADWSRSDHVGRTALHHSLDGRGLHCLQYLLHRDADTGLQDLDGMTVWHMAAQKGNVQALRMLLSGLGYSASALSLRANDGRTPFLCASASESKEAMSMLLGAGSSLTETASDGSSSLHYAAESGNLEAVKFLVAQTVDPFAVNHNGLTALHNAVEGGREGITEIVRILLETGVDPCRPRNDVCAPLQDLVRNIRKDYLSSDLIDCLFAASRTLLGWLPEKAGLPSVMGLGSELLYLACSKNFPSAHETVLALLEFGVDPNARFEGGRTALMAAAGNGRESSFSTLLLHGADPCVKDSDLRTALHCACLNDHRRILVLLRDTTIDWNSQATATISGVYREMVTALHIAAEIKNSRVLRYLLNESPMLNINARTDCGDTPLSVATWERASRNVSLLLSKGADTTSIDTFGNSAVHNAAELGYREIIDRFIRHGSDLGLPNRLGLTPELVARKAGHTALAKFIMDYVSEMYYEPNAAPPSQRREKAHESSEALRVAIDLGDVELCKRLVESGADLESGFEGCTGCTPLLYSLHNKKLAIAKYLVSQGASIVGSTCKGWPTRGFTAFHYAAIAHSVVLLRLLLEKTPSEIYNSHSPIHPIHLAVLNDNAKCVKLILDHASKGKGRIPSDQLGTLRQALDRMVNMQVRGDMLHWSWFGTPEECFPRVLEVAKPLHVAASRGHAHIARMLLQYGASVDGGDGRLKTPLHYAAGNGQTSMVELLLDAGANPNIVDSNLRSACIDAAQTDYVDLIRVLIKGGADIRLRSCYGNTALQLAANYGAREVFVLLMTGSDLWAEDAVGRSALWDATWRAWAFPMSFIVNLAPPSEAYECQRFTLLNAAIASHSTTEVRLLLRRAPTGLLPRLLNHRAKDGTPLYVAAAFPKVDTIALLLDAGAQLELEGSEHGTPLMAACATGRLAAVKVLVARGARTSYVKDGNVYSAFAAAKYHPPVRRWLLVGRFQEGPKLLTYEGGE